MFPQYLKQSGLEIEQLRQLPPEQQRGINQQYQSYKRNMQKLMVEQQKQKEIEEEKKRKADVEEAIKRKNMREDFVKTIGGDASEPQDNDYNVNP